MLDANPLTAQPPTEVPLKDAPLILVLAQVRFPFILSIQKSDFVAPFQEAIRENYPISQIEHTHGVIFGPQGVERSEPRLTWRFADVSGNWRVSLASDFVAIETTSYLSRANFLERLKHVLTALDEHIKPQIVERFGLRYIDRLVGQDTKNLSELVRSEVTGILATEFGECVSQGISEFLFKLPGDRDQILARWALLAPNTTIDPAAVEPIGEPSWLLDLDMSVSIKQEFDIDVLMDDAQRFAKRIYTFFRWAVTPDFLRRFGGEI